MSPLVFFFRARSCRASDAPASPPFDARSSTQAACPPALARAIVGRAHLASLSGTRAERVKELVESVLEPAVPIQIEGPDASLILAWSLDTSTRNEETSADGPRVWVHGREATLRAIRSLPEQTGDPETSQPPGAP